MQLKTETFATNESKNLKTGKEVPQGFSARKIFKGQVKIIREKIQHINNMLRG